MKTPSALPLWHCVGRVEDLPASGAYLKAPLTPAGVVVVRSRVAPPRRARGHEAMRFPNLLTSPHPD